MIKLSYIYTNKKVLQYAGVYQLTLEIIDTEISVTLTNAKDIFKFQAFKLDNYFSIIRDTNASSSLIIKDGYNNMNVPAGGFIGEIFEFLIETTMLFKREYYAKNNNQSI